MLRHMPPGTYRGAIAAARQGGTLPTVCRCRHKECKCDQGRAPPLAAQMEVERRKAQTRQLLLDTPDEAAIRIAFLLGDPRQMLSLAIACRRFRVRSFAWWRAVNSRPTTALVGTAKPIALVEEAARRWVQWLHELRLPTLCSTPDVAGHKPTTWLAQLHEVRRQHSLAASAPTVFTRCHLFIELSEDGHVATRKKTLDATGPIDASHRTAATNIAMRSGRHYAEFTVLEGVCMFLGVVSSTWNVELGDSAERVAGAVMYHICPPHLSMVSVISSVRGR